MDATKINEGRKRKIKLERLVRTFNNKLEESGVHCETLTGKQHDKKVFCVIFLIINLEIAYNTAQGRRG